MNKTVWVVAILGLSACSTGIDTRKYNSEPASRESFQQCHGYSCTYKSPAGFTPKEWGKVSRLFKPVAKTPKEERAKIARAIALMERLTGAKTGTSEDLPMAGAFKESGLQLDCIDETINTTHYVEFLQEAGFLKFYNITEPTHRGYVFDGRWPHNTAVIEETKTGARYVVDSFYRANGEEPYIMPRAAWLAGWKPAGANQ